ncbi:MCE family protein [Haloechinothrix sp. YIM 98757]|uniref:MCE family protein n=1 Tax=Haloechinothrix aidingensis TaxID=2752311 RepID=A0A838AD43_9PSEU|nr:MlaD family protein [Haloechinothrix aidingensis]MBA0127199.1 MCE family protein [Haloechinothrix aidingensis]
MTTMRSRGARIATMVAVAGLAVVLATAGVADDTDDVTITAWFGDASPMVPGNEIKASGVTVGEIDSIELEDERAKVVMSVDRAVLPLYRDARATITLKDLFGERYIKLERGSGSEPLAEGSLVLSEDNTGRVVDLQDILNEVDDPTGTALAALLTTLGEAANGRGEQIADGIAALEPAMRQTDELAAILGEHNKLLTDLVDSVQPAVSALADGRGETLDSLVDSTELTLSTVARRSAETRAALQRLPGTLADAQRTLARVAGVSEDATPTLADLRPVTGDLNDVAGELHRFADAVDPALASLTPVLERAERMLDEAEPLLDSLQPAGEDLRGVAAHGRTLMDEALSKRLDNLMEFVRGWSLSTSGYDGLSHYFRAAVVSSPRGLGTTGLGAIPGAPEAEEVVPDTPLPGATLPPPIGPEDSDGGEDDGADASPDGEATGLTEEQEQSMLGQLLGGQ